MQTRSGKKLPFPKSRQTIKEVRIPSRKRHALTNKAVPPTKKQKSPKAVRFQHDADCEHGLPRYKGPFPNNSLELEKESGSSEEFLRRMSIKVDELLAEAEVEEEKALEPDELEPCELDAIEDEDDGELVADFLDGLEEETVISLIDDFHGEVEAQLQDQRPLIPKSANYDSLPDEQDVIVEDTASPNPSPTNQTDKDREYKQRYLDLKTTAWRWSSTYFSPPCPISASTKPALNLTDLCHTSPQLMEYANYISASTDSSTWEDVFNEQRAFLVYSILGKMLEVHVFGHEMFGATEEQLHNLRAADEECMMDDGFTRQIQRARAISTFLGDKPTIIPPNFLASQSALQASLLQMLSPLHSPSPLPPKASTLMKTHLSTLLFAATTLSLSLRRSPRTLYNWHTPPSPGTAYSSTTMHIPSHSSADCANSQREATTDTRVVTMAGWPSCVAYAPTTSGGRIVGRADVRVRWGEAVEPLAVRATNWLGPSLRVEMGGRVERRDRGGGGGGGWGGFGVGLGGEEGVWLVRW